jgi:hypothetical protein
VKRIQNTWLILVILGLCTSMTLSQIKLAQTGFNFLSLSSDARYNGMGGAVNSLSGFSGAMSSNPASMAEMPTFFSASFDMNKWIADINYISASVIVSPSSGDYGTVGLSVQSVDYGDVEGTMVDRNNPNGYDDIGIIKPTALAIGLGYSKMISKQFGVGARIKYAYQSLGENTFFDNVPAGATAPTYGVVTKKNKTDAVAYDFGTIYKTGIKSIAFGMSVTNFSKAIKFESEDFQLPLLFTIGVSANLFELINSPQSHQELMLSVDWTHPRSHPEQLKIGAEYRFMQILSLRGGYVSGNDENSFTCGVGVSSFGFEIDYSYIPFGVFNSVQQFTARVSL